MKVEAKGEIQRRTEDQVADLIIYNGRCMTVEKEGEVFSWIAVKGNRIMALGNGEDYRRLEGKTTLGYDCRGTTVLPGFIDSHFHLVQSALNKKSIDLSPATSYEDIGEILRQTKEKKALRRIRAIGLSIDQLREKCPPTRQILDGFCDEIPLWINSVEYQVSMLNTHALLHFKVPFTTQGVEKDDKGMPTGVFRRQANAILRTNILNSISDDIRWQAVDELMPQLVKNGITTLNAMEGGTLYSDKDAEFVFHHSKDFPVDIALFYQTMDLKTVMDKNLPRIGGSLYLDGTFGSRTAALTFDYADAPGHRGCLCLEQEEIDEFVLDCYRQRIQLALYTIGDRAIEAAIVAHEKAAGLLGDLGLRHRLEHVELPDSNHIRRAKALGLIFSVQPTYESYWGGTTGMYFHRLGEHYQQTNPYREILDGGVTLCGGSDSDVTEPRPMLGIHGAVNHPVAKHRVRLYEAINMFTMAGAYGICQEDSKGSLKPGKIADIVVLDHDLDQVRMEELEQVQVKLVVKDGISVYDKEEMGEESC